MCAGSQYVEVVENIGEVQTVDGLLGSHLLDPVPKVGGEPDHSYVRIAHHTPVIDKQTLLGAADVLGLASIQVQNREKTQ